MSHIISLAGYLVSYLKYELQVAGYEFPVGVYCMRLSY